MYERNRTLLWCSALIIVALAGCLSDEDGLGDTGDDAAQTGNQLDPDEGAIHGRVLNDGLEPVEEATVRDQATDAAATTNESGDYRIDGLEPGERNFAVEASGHAPSTEQVELLGGEPVRKDFLINRVRGADPYKETHQQVGFLECQMGLAVLLANCIPIQNVLNEVGTNPTNTEQIHKWEIRPTEGLEAIVLEMVWEPTPLTTAEELVFLVEPDGSGLDGGDWGSVQGASVLRYMILDEGDTAEILSEMIEAADEDEPYQTRVFPPSDLGNVVFQQTFEIFATHFYYSVPSDTFTAVPDDYIP